MTAPTTCTELLQCLIRLASVNDRVTIFPERPLLEWVQELVKSWGLQSRRLPVRGGSYNLLISASAAFPSATLVFECHVDTVGGAGMTIDPFGGEVRDGRIYGRGSSDTKGAAAAMLWELYQRKMRGADLSGIAVVLTVDEEETMYGARDLAKVLRDVFPNGIRGMIVGEPTGLKPVVAHNGLIRWKTITRGLAAHSSDPSRGDSAISKMVRVVRLLEETWIPGIKRTHPLTGRSAASINMIRGGVQGNVIPDYCEIEVDRRLVPGEQIESALKERDEVLRGEPVEHCELHVVPALDDASSRAFHEWLHPILTAQGVDASPCGAPYGTNASHYAAVGVPAIVLGPGDITQAHTHDEWLALDQLEKACAVYGAMMDATAAST